MKLTIIGEQVKRARLSIYGNETLQHFMIKVHTSAKLKHMPGKCMYIKQKFKYVPRITH